jgi:putative N-acetyltransferase (TIGR04045 family)
MPEIVCRPIKNQEELNVSFRIRKKVFVEEQGLFKRTDRDRHDKNAIHIVAIYKNRIVGTVRVYLKNGDVWHGSRLAVLKRFRGRVGRQLVQKAVEVVRDKKARHFEANILLKNVPFFKMLGWAPIGPVISYRGQPHQVMKAVLKEAKGFRD